MPVSQRGYIVTNKVFWFDGKIFSFDGGEVKVEDAPIWGSWFPDPADVLQDRRAREIERKLEERAEAERKTAEDAERRKRTPIPAGMGRVVKR